MNRGKTKYLKLERDARQEDLVSAYFIILDILKIFFLFVKNNSEDKGLNIFKHEFSYTAYADHTTSFLKDRKCIIEWMN